MIETFCVSLACDRRKASDHLKMVDVDINAFKRFYENNKSGWQNNMKRSDNNSRGAWNYCEQIYIPEEALNTRQTVAWTPWWLSSWRPLIDTFFFKLKISTQSKVSRSPSLVIKIEEPKKQYHNQRRWNIENASACVRIAATIWTSGPLVRRTLEAFTKRQMRPIKWITIDWSDHLRSSLRINHWRKLQLLIDLQECTSACFIYNRHININISFVYWIVAVFMSTRWLIKAFIFLIL